MYAGIVDNTFNEYVAVLIAKSEEYFVRSAIQLFMMVGMFQLMLRPENLAENLAHVNKHKFKVRFNS
jgi:hypothetical protein